MRSLLATIFDAFIGRSIADDEDYDEDAVLHVNDAEPDEDVYGQPALCGYVFTKGKTRSGRFSEYCPDCVDILGYIPGEGPVDDEDDDEDDALAGGAS